MVAARVSGVSALTFVSEDAGTQHRIPLSALPIDSTGIIDLDAWPPGQDDKFPPADRDLIKLLVADLLKRGIVSAAPPDDSTKAGAKDPKSSGKGGSGGTGADTKSGDSGKSGETSSGTGTGSPADDSTTSKKVGP
jgi:hypothetical protein